MRGAFLTLKENRAPDDGSLFDFKRKWHVPDEGRLFDLEKNRHAPDEGSLSELKKRKDKRRKKMKFVMKMKRTQPLLTECCVFWKSSGKFGIHFVRADQLQPKCFTPSHTAADSLCRRQTSKWGKKKRWSWKEMKRKPCSPRMKQEAQALFTGNGNWATFNILEAHMCEGQIFQ